MSDNHSCCIIYWLCIFAYIHMYSRLSVWEEKKRDVFLSLQCINWPNVLQLCIRYHSRFFVQVGHETTYADIRISSCFHWTMPSSDLPKLVRTSVKPVHIIYVLKYQFWKKSLWKNATLSSWTLFQHICLHFWVWLLLYSAITPKSEDKYVVKVLNSTELHFSEVYFFQNWYFRRPKISINWNPTFQTFFIK